MSPPRKAITPAEQYNQALHYARDHNLPPDHPRPRPTSDWPSENVAFLGCYVDWLLDGGTSQLTTRIIHIPMAGHVLGLALKPHDKLDLASDLDPAMDYILTKRLSAAWTKNCRNSLVKFRRFIQQERGIVEPSITPYKPILHSQGLPEWLIRELERFQHIRQRNWRPARLQQNIHRFWSGHLRIWRFLCKQLSVVEMCDIKRQYLFDYIDHRLTGGYATSGINSDLRGFHAFLGFLQEQGYVVPQSLFRIPGLKERDRLPKYLTDDQVRLLRDDFEHRVSIAKTQRKHRDSLLDQAAFYLLWQTGLRLGEVEELRLEDLDLEGRKLDVRQGKGMKDRTVYLTDRVVSTLRAYLDVRGPCPTSHIFAYRNLPVCKELIRDRIKAAGERVGVKVYPHRLRHTCATQLINAGCQVTSIQRFLGHKQLNTTMIYARVYDHNVATDYYSAMAEVESRLDLIPLGDLTSIPLGIHQRRRLFALTINMTEPEMSLERRLDIVSKMRQLLLMPAADEREHSVAELCELELVDC